MNRGISGGERKRVSIGYELITEPSILLLDEPTSGLDSHNAKQVVHQMRLEAQRGLSVVATIHQPSSDIFFMFDRVILLSEGRTIYNGRPEDVRTYFEQDPFKLVMGLYSNPADKLLTLAACPRKCISSEKEKIDETIPLITLENHAREATKKWLEDERKLDSESDSADGCKSRINVNTLVVEKKVSFVREVKLILDRIVVQALRLPLAIMVLVINGVIQGLLQSEVFREVANTDFDMFDRNIN